MIVPMYGILACGSLWWPCELVKQTPFRPLLQLLPYDISDTEQILFYRVFGVVDDTGIGDYSVLVSWA